MPKRPPADVEKAVNATRLYIGSTACDIGVAQKLYERMHAASLRVAKRLKADPEDVFSQIAAEARRRGGKIPTPGKDY